MTERTLIPRKLLFGNPTRALAKLSPDGRYVSYLAPLDGVLNLWIAPIDDLAAAKPITAERVRNIRFYEWAYTSRHLLYMQDANGDENWHVICADVESGAQRDLTPIEGVNATSARSATSCPMKRCSPSTTARRSCTISTASTC